jgi:hypothetical protein
MVNHPCPNCGEIFNKKSTFNYHINRKRPCVITNISITPITPTITPITPENNLNILLCEDVNTIKNENEINCENDKKFNCGFCNQKFLRKYNLERHLDGRCKLKRDKENKSSENDLKPIVDDEKFNLILKRLDDLENENKKLKMKIKKTKKTTNININQNNNIVNQNNILINFNDLDLYDVDKKLFIQPIMNPRLHGKLIILQMIENVYINNEHPEYQNILITDKNRGYVKIYNNGKWKTDNIETINMVIDGIISHSKNILVELKQQYLNNINAKNRLNTSEKYINLCDSEYLEDLEDQQFNDDVDNKKQIKRCKDFREMVYKDTINLFHDNKKLLLK